LQDSDEVPDSGTGSESGFEVAAEIGERSGELPVAVDRGVIEGRRFAFQNSQKMQGIEHFLAAAVASSVAGDDLPVGHHRDAIDVPFHRHDAERPTPRYAVTVAVVGHGLVLVHLAALHHTGIERPFGNRQGRRLVLLEAGAD